MSRALHGGTETPAWVNFMHETSIDVGLHADYTGGTCCHGLGAF